MKPNITAIRERLAAATPQLFRLEFDREKNNTLPVMVADGGRERRPGDYLFMGIGYIKHNRWVREKDHAACIKVASQDLAALCDEVERLEAQLLDLRDTISPSSTSVENSIEIARATRHERDELRHTISRLTGERNRLLREVGVMSDRLLPELMNKTAPTLGERTIANTLKQFEKKVEEHIASTLTCPNPDSCELCRNAQQIIDDHKHLG